MCPQIRSIVFILALTQDFHIAAVHGQSAPLVEISNGLLQGTIEKSYNGRDYSSFYGVPYARPPVGDLRFEAPLDPYNWTGTWIANTRHVCLQSYETATKLGVSGEEDCLHLNVFVPRAKPTPADNLNVVVHFHGGAFMLGSSHFYAGPKYLMDEEVVFVTINYRLGPFGFLSTGDAVQPGNNGLKDQSLALKWIQRNIKYFGGNPDAVTLTGLSAGGASVHFHYFSPLSKGLFVRGLSQSGTALGPWALQEAPLEKAKRLAVLLGCPDKTSREIIDCLKTRSGKSIADAVKYFFVYDGFPFSPFGPVVETIKDGAFLSEHPYKMLIDKTVTDLPWITAVTTEDGIFPAVYFNKQLRQLDEEFENIAPHVLDYNYTIPCAQKSSVTDRIKRHYFKESVNLKDFIKLCQDRHFFTAADLAAKLQARANKSPVYFYIFGYRGQRSVSELFSGTSDNFGVSHGDDVLYYLKTDLAEEKLSAADEKMKAIFLKWLISYTNGEDPVFNGVSWNPVQGGQSLQYLYIQNTEEISMKIVEDLGDGSFWNSLYLNEYDRYDSSANIKDEL